MSNDPFLPRDDEEARRMTEALVADGQHPEQYSPLQDLQNHRDGNPTTTRPANLDLAKVREARGDKEEKPEPKAEPAKAETKPKARK